SENASETSHLYPLDKSVFPFVNRAMNQRWFVRGCGGGDLIALHQQCSCAPGLCVGVAVNRAERLALGNPVTDFLMNRDTHGRIDGIFFALAASAQDDACGAHLFASDRG